MKILNKMSIKNLKLNKKRTVSTIIGIVLSVALICAVSCMFASFQETLVKRTVKDTGYYHLKLGRVTDDQISELKNNRDIKESWIIEEVGYTKFDGATDEETPYLRVMSMDEKSFEAKSFKLIEGRFPKNSNEIVISKNAIANSTIEYKIGSKIKANIGKRVSSGDEELMTSTSNITEGGYNLYTSSYEDGERLVNTKEAEFTIVGIMKRPDYSFENLNCPGYTAITTNMEGNQKDIYLTLKKPHEYKETISQILGVKDYGRPTSQETENMKYEDYDVNNELLRWEVFAFSDSTVATIYAMVGIVIFIIIFTSVFCIRNSFAIALAEKIKMYGMLASVGATKRQIKKNVIFEAMILGLIGIPLGILLGIFAVFVLIKIVNILIAEALSMNIVMKISILPIMLSVVLGIVTIYLSAISSARKASKISPIEQLRNSSDIKIKSKKLKTPKIISKIFKTGGELAYKNLKRSKKKYRTTVISLVVSIFIFITMNSFITNIFGITNMYYEDYDYNMITGIRTTEETIKALASLEHADEIFVLYENHNGMMIIKDQSKITEDMRKCMDDYGEDKQAKQIGPNVVALDDASFRKYAKKIGQDYEKIKDKAILCDDFILYTEETNSSKNVRTYTYKKGDTISAKLVEENSEKDINIEVAEVTETRPYGLENSTCHGGYLVVHKDMHKEFDFETYVIAVNSSEPSKLEDEIKNAKIDIDMRNMEEEAKQEKSMILVINIFLYGFIAVITLIGVTNIFNTITSNIELRQQEFAMLKSIGMTKKEFNRMINLETIFYSTKALIYGIILGLLGTFALYKAASIKIDRGIYIPVKPILISIVFVFILVFIIMRYSINKVNKQNTIETIRKENI